MISTVTANERLIREYGAGLGLPIARRPQFTYTLDEGHHEARLTEFMGATSVFRWQNGGSLPVASINPSGDCVCVLGCHRMLDVSEVAVVQAHEMFHIAQMENNRAGYDFCAEWLSADHRRLRVAAQEFPRCPVVNRRRMRPGFESRERMLERATDLYALWATANLGLYGHLTSGLYDLAAEFVAEYLREFTPDTPCRAGRQPHQWAYGGAS